MPTTSTTGSTDERTFDDFYLSDEMRRALASVDYHHPTKVQTEAIPLILAGIDLTLQSETGSGKTAAFAIPTIEMLDPKPGRIDVLVLTPTRELAKQVCREFEGLGQFKDLEATPIYGGTSYERQYEALETASIVVATPGRLLDLCQKGRLDLGQLQMLILDEADEMLSMGFRDDILSVIDYLPEERQSLLCSATITREIRALAEKILFYPEFVSLSSDSVAANAVTHDYYNVRGVGRSRDLLKVIEYEQPESALVFANTRKDTFAVNEFLQRHGYDSAVLNGEMAQKDREKTLRSLRDGEVDYIVATDVAARGIDITDLTHVINYALPDSAEVYVHRTGRTGRAGKTGKAVSLVAPTEVDTFFQIQKVYDIKLEEQTLPSTAEIMEARQTQALFDLEDQLEDIDYLPYGGHLKLAKELLAGSDEIDGRIDRNKMVARLLSLADKVIDGEFQRPDKTSGTSRKSTRTKKSKTPEKSKKSKPSKKSAKSDKSRSSKKSSGSKGGRAKARGKSASKSRTPDSKKKSRSNKSDSKSGSKRKRRRSRSNKSKRDANKKKKRSSSSNDKSGQSKRRRRRRKNNDNSSGASADKSTRQSTTDTDEEDDMDQIKAAAPKVDSPSETKKMYMNLGRNAFDSAKELVEMLCFMSGTDPEDFGRISIESSYSFIHIREDYFKDVIAALNNQEWEGHNITAEPARN